MTDPAAARHPVGPSDITVVGAGLAGSLMALLLGQEGRRVRLFERRSDPRLAGADAGRSINLAISARGLAALDAVGLRDTILEAAVPMRGRMIHDLQGGLTFQPYGARGQAINSVSRAGLNVALLNAAGRHPNIEVRFRHRCTDGAPERGALTFETPEGDASVSSPLIIAADGAYSAVRGLMQKRERFDYRQDYLAHGYKELYIPPGPGGGFLMEPNALHIWPRGGYMMIALPNRDGSFTCTLFWPYEGPVSFAAIRTEADLRKVFAETYPDAVPLMPTLAHDFFTNPTGSLVTIRCAPWHLGGRTVLLGDAAHAIVPFYGQGANAAFEDCVVLRDCLHRHPDSPEAAFVEFERRRKPDAEAIADLALANFVEMRDRVASPWFLLRKKLEKVLHRLFPRWFLPLYTMVSFTTIPYAKAVARARRQDRTLEVVGWVLLVVVLGWVWFCVI